MKAPFALKHASVVDGFHARAGTAFFRVNGATRVGVGWRLLVVGATMLIGLLAGLKPAIAAGSALGTIQTLLIWVVQIILGAVCFCVSPDADRIFSALAGTQFLVEGVSNMLYFFSSFLSKDAKEALQGLAFSLALTGVFVPILQLLEQRLITPIMKIVYTDGCNPRALGGALLVLVISLPGAIKKAVTMLSGGGGGGGGGGGADVGKIAKGMGTLLGRSAASGDVGGKKVKASTATRLPSFGGSKKDKELNSPQRV